MIYGNLMAFIGFGFPVQKKDLRVGIMERKAFLIQIMFQVHEHMVCHGSIQKITCIYLVDLVMLKKVAVIEKLLHSDCYCRLSK